MLFQSSVVLWVVTQVLLSGSQTNAQTEGNSDGEFCEYIEDSQCSEEAVRNSCPNMCKPYGCLTPWFWLDSQCFQVFDTGNERKWSAARAHCNVEGKEAGGDLAVPNNVTKLHDYMLVNQIPEGNYWIGGSTWFAAGSWHWVNGKLIPDYHGPGSRLPEECLYIKNKIHPVGGPLGNEGCGATLHFVCEKFPYWINAQNV